MAGQERFFWLILKERPGIKFLVKFYKTLLARLYFEGLPAFGKLHR